MNYEVHFGVELPFWISLPDGSYQIRLDGETHKLNFSNHVSRIEIGDLALGQGAIGAQWVHTNDAEVARKRLQADHAGMPVTRHDAKTVLTHARSIEVSDETVLHDLYKARSFDWYEQTLRLFNKFIQAYMIKAYAGVGIGQAGAVASWDLGGGYWCRSGKWRRRMASRCRLAAAMNSYDRSPPRRRRSALQMSRLCRHSLPWMTNCHWSTCCIAVRRRKSSAAPIATRSSTTLQPSNWKPSASCEDSRRARCPPNLSTISRGVTTMFNAGSVT